MGSKKLSSRRIAFLRALKMEVYNFQAHTEEIGIRLKGHEKAVEYIGAKIVNEMLEEGLIARLGAKPKRGPYREFEITESGRAALKDKETEVEDVR